MTFDLLTSKLIGSLNTRVMGFHPPKFGFPRPFRSRVIMSRVETRLRQTDRQTTMAIYNAPPLRERGHNKYTVTIRRKLGETQKQPTGYN